MLPVRAWSGTGNGGAGMTAPLATRAAQNILDHAAENIMQRLANVPGLERVTPPVVTSRRRPRVVNDTGLPEPLFRAGLHDPYDSGGCDFFYTQQLLTDPPPGAV